MTKLSLLTTIYNGEEFLEEMFESVFSQTFQEFEWIIVDDGSTDSTWEKLKQYNDKRIRMYRLPANKGVGFANKYALSLANGDYIAKVDADDISLPNRFEKQVDFLDTHPKIDLIDTFIDYFPHDEKVENSELFHYLKNSHQIQINRERSSDEISEELFWGCWVINAAIMGRREQINTIGYSEDMIQGEDYLMFYEMNKAGMKFYRFPEKLVKIRVSNFSTTTRNQHMIKDISLQIKGSELESFFRDKSRLYVIWGAGQNGKDTFDYIQIKFQIKPFAFFDSAEEKIGKKISNIPIMKPTDVKKYKICVASSYGKDEIISYLKNQGCKPLIDYYVVI